MSDANGVVEVEDAIDADSDGDDCEGEGDGAGDQDHDPEDSHAVDGAAPDANTRAMLEGLALPWRADGPCRKGPAAPRRGLPPEGPPIGPLRLARRWLNCRIRIGRESSGRRSSSRSRMRAVRGEPDGSRLSLRSLTPSPGTKGE